MRVCVRAPVCISSGVKKNLSSMQHPHNTWLERQNQTESQHAGTSKGYTLRFLLGAAQLIEHISNADHLYASASMLPVGPLLL
jgi:hypothetical protein